MARMRSAAVSKRFTHIDALGGINSAEIQKPREGTNLRAYYDLLTSNVGVTIDLVMDSRSKEQLEDFYGLEIKRIGRGRCQCVSVAELPDNPP